MRFDTERGEHFFRSTLVQTLFYGMFSAWVLWSKSHPPTDKKSRFDWRLADYYLRVPIIRKLFREVADPGQLEPLNLPEVLDWACSVLNRVDRASFFASFDEGAAVQYFYEPFLEAFDPELRKELGVWYTPREVVQYMVERVDRVLREQMGRPSGLADPNVYVLDPCCGTGAFLVAVLNRIAKSLSETSGDALMGTDLKKAATERVFGFELLPAPFVVSHLQIGLILQHHGAPLSEKKKERVGVYLTNALTGSEPPKQPKKLPFVELEEERDAADHVKRDTPILVILGDPPYNSFAGIARLEEERDVTIAYRTTKKAPAPEGQGLNDLYVRFFRMAERRIVEKTGHGIVCFISNYSWLDGLSFTGMRERYQEVFDHIWIDSLNGDKYKTGKLTPDGEPDPTF
jgi:predicted helicase